MLTSLELCTGGGGQALGLEQAGFRHEGLVEVDAFACATLRMNRPSWNVLEADLREFDGRPFHGVDLLAAGVPCPPFSVAGKQLGPDDDRDLFPEALRIVSECHPRAVFLENVPGLFDARFADYRAAILLRLEQLGYSARWEKLNARDYGVPQSRPRTLLVALRHEVSDRFAWPRAILIPPPTVGETLYEEMSSLGWIGAKNWASRADSVAPTLVGGSKKHGGPDLGPTRARAAWMKLGVDGRGIANAAPAQHFEGAPRLTLGMTAALQGFPGEWIFAGGKTQAYRQIGNAMPPPLAKAVGRAIRKALTVPASRVRREVA